MKQILLLTLFILPVLFNASSQTTYTININGLAFSPDELTVEVGDTVFFNGSATHPILEVSLGTWNANGSEGLSNGFAIPSGFGKLVFKEKGTHYYICENHIGSGMKGIINVNESTATNINNVNSLEAKIYPNPLTTSFLNIEIPNYNEAVTINIFDITGRIKISSDVTPTDGIVKIDGSELTPGAYIIQVNSGNNQLTSKIIKN